MPNRAPLDPGLGGYVGRQKLINLTPPSFTIREPVPQSRSPMAVSGPGSKHPRRRWVPNAQSPGFRRVAPKASQVRGCCVRSRRHSVGKRFASGIYRDPSPKPKGLASTRPPVLIGAANPSPSKWRRCSKGPSPGLFKRQAGSVRLNRLLGRESNGTQSPSCFSRSGGHTPPPAQTGQGLGIIAELAECGTGRLGDRLLGTKPLRTASWGA